jgi:hypothetical protein
MLLSTKIHSQRAPYRALSVLSVITAALLAAACEGGHGPLAPDTVGHAPVAWVNVGAGTAAVPAGASVQLTAKALDAQGRPLAGRAVTWTSTDMAVATVSQDGVLTAIAAGQVGITAAIGGVSGRIELRVFTAPEFVIVLPGGNGLQPGESVQLYARGLSTQGDSLYRLATWSSENPAVATVDAAGRVTAHRPGSAVIAANMDGVVGRAIVFVAGAQSRPLVSVDGGSLPAGGLVRTATASDGSAIQQTLVVTSGELRLADGRYVHSIAIAVYEGAVKVGLEVHEDSGVMLFDMLTGNPIFESTRTAGLTYRGEFLYANGFTTGEIVVTRTLSGTSRAAEFRFGPA